jgi:hypothetical protein
MLAGYRSATRGQEADDDQGYDDHGHDDPRDHTRSVPRGQKPQQAARA